MLIWTFHLIPSRRYFLEINSLPIWRVLDKLTSFQIWTFHAIPGKKGASQASCVDRSCKAPQMSGGEKKTETCVCMCVQIQSK